MNVQTISPAQTVTELELKVLNNIVHSEYHSMDNLKDRVNYHVWSFSATRSKKQLAGALGSLCAKGLAATTFQNGDPECWITPAGFKVWQAAQI